MVSKRGDVDRNPKYLKLLCLIRDSDLDFVTVDDIEKIWGAKYPAINRKRLHRYIYSLRAQGLLVNMARGVYRLPTKQLVA